MPGFDAANVVEPLDYDFSAIKGLEGVKGTITEPTGLQVQKYLNDTRREMERMRREIGDVPADATGDELLSVLEKLDPQASTAAQKRNAEILAALCSGKPTAAQLMKLPYRVMSKFGEWIAKEVLDPEAVTGAGKTQALSLVSSSAG